MNIIKNTRLVTRILELSQQHCSAGGTIFWKSIAKELSAEFPEENLNYERVRSIYRRYTNANKTVENIEMPIMSKKEQPRLQRSGDNLEASIGGITENPANFSEHELAKLFNIDSTKWENTGLDVNSWNQTQKGPNNMPIQIINYSVKARFRRRQDITINEQVLREIFEDAQSLYKEFLGNSLVQKPLIESGNTLITGVFDVHLGKLAWWKETGENYDIKIASKRFLTAVKNIVDKAVSLSVEKIIFPVGNDFFQFDNEKPTTTKDTVVDTDVRWQKLFQKGIALLRAAIDYCSTFAEVDVIWVPGNHDFKTSFYAFETLRGWYHANERVTIDENIQTRTYRLVGVNLLGFTHGNNEKQSSLHGLMSNEVPELWGKSKYREWIIGHFHKGMLSEDMGVVIRVLGSITGTDAWHYQNGFVGSLKAAQGLIYNKNHIGPHIIIYDSVDIEKEREEHQ